MRRVALPVLVTLSLLWVLAIAGAPVAARNQHAPVVLTGAAVYAVGAAICHQKPERSFHSAGGQWAVCARCTGLYVGGTVGLLLWALWRRTDRPSPLDTRGFRRALIVCAIPTLLTVVTAAIGWWDPSNVVRSVFAVPLGAAAGTVIAAVAAGDLR
jgi:uncharacterized membrane protein